MQNKVHYVSQEGLEKLKKELHERKTILRREIADRIDRAKELGDLSENAEYAEAKDEQAFNEGRIFELEDMLNNMVVIDKDSNDGKDTVHVGSTIVVKNGAEEKEYTITGASESDPTKGLISNESPLGRAFIGKKKDEEVEIKIPVGIVTYKIIKIK